MKLMWTTMIVAVAVAVLGGCQSVVGPTWYRDNGEGFPWRGFPYVDAKEHLNYYKNVILVCITADHGEQIEMVDFRGDKKDGGYVHHYKATVVRSYKGDCKVTDRVGFTLGYCPCGGKREVTTNSFVGDLMFLLVENDVRQNTEFGLDPADTDRYSPTTDRLFTYILGERRTKQKDSQQTSPGDVATRAAPEK